MIYVVLRSAELQLARIRQRVSDGGHDVPEDKVRQRRLRSFDEFSWFAAQVDDCYVYDNSTGEPEIIAARISRGPLWQFKDIPADLLTAINNGEIGRHLRTAT